MRFLMTVGGLILAIQLPVFAADTSSGISLHNAGGSAVTLKGVYVQQLKTGVGCAALAGNTRTPANGFTYGVLWVSVPMASGAIVEMGANFVYQMMASLLYQVYEDGAGSLSSTCTPGTGACNGFGPTTNKWCINLDLTSGNPVPISTAVTGLVPLVSSHQYVVTCDDSTFTCTATAFQQDFN